LETVFFFFHKKSIQDVYLGAYKYFYHRKIDHIRTSIFSYPDMMDIFFEFWSIQ